MTKELEYPEPIEGSKADLHKYNDTYIEVLRIVGSRAHRRGIVKHGKIVARMDNNSLHVSIYNRDGKVVHRTSSSYKIGDVYERHTIKEIKATLIKEKSEAGYFFTYIIK